MAYTIQDTKSDLTRIVHSTGLNTITNLNFLFYTAARNVLAKVDPPETIKIAQITNAIHDDIFDYPAPSDLKGNKVIDIRPQVNRTEVDSFAQRFSSKFDKYKTKGTFQIRNNGGVKTLRLSEDVLPSPKTLHQMDSITANGTWAATAAVSNLTADTLDKVSGSASLNFDMDGSGTTGYIEISNMTAVDLTNEDEIGQLFLWLYIPDTSIFTNVILRWGNDTSNYWSRTATAPHDQSSWKTGWNLVSFNWNGATETGTVAPASIDYLRITLTLSSATADTDFRVDKITCSSGEIFEIEYYSEFLFRNSSGTYQQKTSDDTDIINLDEDGYNLFLNECGYLAAQQAQGSDGESDKKFFREELYGDGKKLGLYEIYKTDHPSEAIKPQEVYYNFNLYRRSRTNG